MSMRAKEHPNTQHVGNPRGLIAIWCDESEALDIADRYRYPDTFGIDIIKAVQRAYPRDEEDE